MEIDNVGHPSTQDAKNGSTELARAKGFCRYPVDWPESLRC